MENDKELKENKEKKKERGPRISNIKPQDLEFNKNIDDKYTSSFIDKYKSGKTTNKWFTASGILSILFGITCIFVMLIIIFKFIANKGSNVDYDAEKKKIIISGVVVFVVGILSILIGCKIKSFSKYIKDDYVKNLGTIILFIILQLLFGGFILAIFTIVGYFAGIGLDYGAIYYNRIEESSSKSKRIEELKQMYREDLIDFEEYQRLKDEILDQEE